MQSIEEIRAGLVQSVRTKSIEATQAASAARELEEAAQRAEWIEQLRAMPDIRPCETEAARAATPCSASILAECIVREQDLR